MEINFEPLPIQYKVWNYLFDNKTNNILFGGAARVSKSYLLCAWSVIYCLTYPNIAGAICRSRISYLKKTTLITLFEFFRHQNIKEGKDFHFNRQDLIITFNNGSKLHFLELYDNPSDPDFDRIMSMSLTFAGVDEVSEISSNAINKLQTRLSHMLKEYNLIPKLLLVSNPNKGWLYTEYYKPFTTKTLPQHRKVVLGLPDDNKYVSELYIKNLESLDEGTVQRLRYGNWEYSDDDFSLFKYDLILQMFYNEALTGGDMFLSCDIANIGGDNCVFVLWSGNVIIKFFVYEKKDTRQIVIIIKNLMSKYKVPIKNVVIDADGVGIGVADYLKGCYVFKGGSMALLKENYANLRTQCYFKLADTVSEISIQDNKYQEKVIQELQAQKLKNVDNDNKTLLERKDKIKRMIGRSPDFSDAIMMKMVYLIKKERLKTIIY